MVAASKFNNTSLSMATAGATTAGMHLVTSVDTLKLALYTTAPVAGDLVYNSTLGVGGGLEVSVPAVGYTAAGNTCSTSNGAISTTTMTLKCSNPAVWTASGAGFALQYFLLYDSTATTATCNLLMYWNNGSTITLAASDTLTVTDFTSATGYLSISCA